MPNIASPVIDISNIERYVFGESIFNIYTYSNYYE